MAYIIIKNYEHFNKALPNWNSPKGRYISSKAHYEKVLSAEGFISKDKADVIAENVRNKRNQDKYDKLSPQAMELLQSVNKDKKGRIHLSGKQIDGLQKLGATLKIPDWCPRHYKEGGYATD